MQELNAAWEVLGDPSARAEYDRSRRSAAAPTPRPAEHESEPWDDEDARVQADIERRMSEPLDLAAAFLRALPVLAVLAILFAIVVFTAFAGGGGSNDGDQPRRIPGPSTPAG